MDRLGERFATRTAKSIKEAGKPLIFAKEYQGARTSVPMRPYGELVGHIRRQRTALGLTQIQLAKIAGTSQSFIAKLEQGNINPSYEGVRRVITALENHSRDEEPTAKDIMRENPVSATPNETVNAALNRMKRHGFSQLPVLDGRYPTGSISERDLLEWLEQGEPLDDLKKRKVEEIMHGSFPIVDPGTRRHTIVELLRDQDAVIVAENGKIVGLVTKSDLW